MTLEHKIIKANDNLTIEVEFKNPYYSGKHLVEEAYEDEEDGKKIKKKRWVDNDPHPHVKKTINVPLNAEGGVDKDGLAVIIEQQAMGVQNRMEAEHTKQLGKKIDLASELGLEPSTE